MGSSHGGYLSHDQGQTWISLPAGTLGNDYRVNDLCVIGNTVMMACAEGLLARSVDSIHP